MARFLCWLIGREPTGAPYTVSRPPCTPGRRKRRRARRPLAGTALPRSPWNRSAGR
ncbi:hypothetical protein ACFY2R_01725 [Micromonospora olivasterospora]|uniref:Uncharacterized protein n=1 Tax=Micromonospora olivasterospora TaxID=1880 RepID=A0A562ICG4_MICOL|nr:hypothetical protein [Micromonospora olivasterospora]TWH68602.1 hypothetical protein JD77_03599 [Micromonospora olivasterospora]